MYGKMPKVKLWIHLAHMCQVPTELCKRMLRPQIFIPRYEISLLGGEVISSTNYRIFSNLIRTLFTVLEG
jgi:hypothetical protein